MGYGVVVRTRSTVLVMLALSVTRPAEAQWITPAPPPRGQVDGMTWTIAGMSAFVALLPQVVAGVELHGDSRVIETRGAVALFLPGTILGAATAVGLGFVEADQEATVLMLVGGPLWSTAGVGLGRLASDSTRAPWLGGSLGFTTFAAQHALMTTAGFADHPPTAVLQALFGAVGGVGCFVDATASSGAEKVVAIGCAAVGFATFTHGAMRAIYGKVSRPSTALRTTTHVAPLVGQGVGGLTLAGAF